MDLKKLAEPFDPQDIEWRIQRNGVSNGKPWAMVLAYITNRAIMERLDDVCGAENWQNEYREWHGTSQLCGISIYVETKHQVTGFSEAEREWITKWDGADATNVEATKGGLSDSMKRAGVQWGIGRYLYKLDTTFVDLLEGRSKDPNAVNVFVDKKNMHFIKPRLPDFALLAQAKSNEVKEETPEPKKTTQAYQSPRKATLADELTKKKTELLEAVKAKGLNNEEFTELKLKTIGITKPATVADVQEVLDALNK